jgi:hypothetical protein
MGVRTLPKALLSINKRVIFQLAPSTPKYSNLGHCIAGPHSSIAGITIWGFSISALDLLPAAIANWLSVIMVRRSPRDLHTTTHPKPHKRLSAQLDAQKWCDCVGWYAELNPYQYAIANSYNSGILFNARASDAVTPMTSNSLQSLTSTSSMSCWNFCGGISCVTSSSTSSSS